MSAYEFWKPPSQPLYHALIWGPPEALKTYEPQGPPQGDLLDRLREVNFESPLMHSKEAELKVCYSTQNIMPGWNEIQS